MRNSLGSTVHPQGISKQSRELYSPVVIPLTAGGVHSSCPYFHSSFVISNAITAVWDELNCSQLSYECTVRKQKTMFLKHNWSHLGIKYYSALKKYQQWPMGVQLMKSHPDGVY